MTPTRGDTSFREAMRSLLVFDGAMGSLLYERGVFVTQNFEQLNVSRPDVVRKIHEEISLVLWSRSAQLSMRSLRSTDATQPIATLSPITSLSAVRDS
jgi:hypothetical protein